MFYMVPALRIGLEGASEWLSGASFERPTYGNYNYCHNLVKYNRIVFSSDLGLAFYTPIGKFGLEFNLIAGYRFN